MLSKQAFKTRYAFDFNAIEQLDHIKKVYTESISNEIQHEEKDAVKALRHYQKRFHDYVEVFLSLIDTDPLQSQASFEDFNAIQYAAYQGYHFYLAQLALPAKDFNCANPYGMTPLHLAATYGHLKTVETLLNKGANPFAQTLNQRLPIFTGLSIAPTPEIKNQKIVIYHLLLSAMLKAKPLQTNSDGPIAHPLFQADTDGDTIAHQMAIGGFDGLIQELIQEKNLQHLLMLPNRANHLPVHMAILQGHTTTVACLLDYHRSQSKPPLGQGLRLPIHYAAETGHSAMVKLCCEADAAAVHAHDSNGETPWHIATRLNHHDALMILETYGGGTEDDLTSRLSYHG